MKLRGSEKNKFYNLVAIIAITFLTFSCFVTFLIDTTNNKGILPVIFFLLMIYSLLAFLYYLFHSYALTKNYTRKMSMEAGDAIVSFAGPLMNIILAFIFSCIYCAIAKFADLSFIQSTTGGVIVLILKLTISINIGLRNI